MKDNIRFSLSKNEEVQLLRLTRELRRAKRLAGLCSKMITRGYVQPAKDLDRMLAHARKLTVDKDGKLRTFEAEMEAKHDSARPRSH